MCSGWKHNVLRAARFFDPVRSETARDLRGVAGRGQGAFLALPRTWASFCYFSASEGGGSAEGGFALPGGRPTSPTPRASRAAWVSVVLARERAALARRGLGAIESGVVTGFITEAVLHRFMQMVSG